MEALAFGNQAFAESVDVSMVSSTTFEEAMRMTNLQRAAFLERVKAHKEAESDHYEGEKERLAQGRAARSPYRTSP